MEIQVGKQSLAFAEAPYIISSASIVGEKRGRRTAREPLRRGGRGRQVRTEHLGGGGEYPAEGSIYAGGRKGRLEKPRTSVICFRGSARAEHCDILRAHGLSGAAVRTLWSVQYLWRSALIGRDVRGGGVCGLCCGDDVEPFCQRGKAVPVSTGICQPAPEIGDVDGHGKWRLCAREKRSKARITGITTGKIVDYGIKDSMNMGAAMAPAASDVICRHLSDFGRNVTDYDKIITGDLGKVGQEILWDLTRAGGYDISSIHTDCGIEIYDADKQGTGAGGSGCGCAAVTLSAHFMRQIEEGNGKESCLSRRERCSPPFPLMRE